MLGLGDLLRLDSNFWFLGGNFVRGQCCHHFRGSIWTYVLAIVAVHHFAPANAAVWNVGNGAWENANSWDTLTVPDSAAEDVLISALGNVEVELSSDRTIGSLTINATNDRLKLNPGATLQLDGSSLTNRGTIELDATAGLGSELSITNNATYTHSGTIRFSDENLATSLEVNGVLSLPTNTTLTIDGPSLGAGRGVIKGAGSIDISPQAELLFNDVGLINVNTDITNNGDIRVAGNNASLVTFNSVAIDNGGAGNDLSVTGNSVVQLNDVSIANGFIDAQLGATLRIFDGTFSNADFQNVNFASGSVSLIDTAEFFSAGSNSILESSASLQLEGDVTVGGILETMPGASITAGNNGRLNANFLELGGSGNLNITVPVKAVTNLRLNRDGTTNFGDIDLSSASLVVADGIAAFGGSQIMIPTARHDAIAAEGDAELHFLGTELNNIGILMALTSSTRFTATTLDNVQVFGGSAEFRSLTTLRNQFESDRTIVLDSTADVQAAGGEVILKGNSEWQFQSVGNSLTPEVVTETPDDVFVIPSGSTVTMTGGSGVIGRAGETHPTMRVLGTLDIEGATVTAQGGGVIAEAELNVSSGADFVILSALFLDTPPGPPLAAAGAGMVTGGVLHVDAGSQVTMKNGSMISGGAIETSGDGAVVVEFNTLSGGFGTLENTTNRGTVIVQGQADFGLRGSVTNDGTIELGDGTTSSFQTTDVFVYGEVGLGGAGTVQMSGMGGARLLAQPGSNGEASHLVNGSTILANRALTIGSSIVNAPILTNRGTIVADDDLEIYLPVGEEVTNEGTIQLTTADSRLFFRTGGSVIRNSGEIILGDAGSRIIVDNYIQDGGMTKGNGTLQGSLTLNGGTMQFDGTLDGNLTFNAGVIEIGDPVGRLSLTRDFDQSAATTLRIDIGGLTPETEFDVLDVQGFFGFLGGPLDVSLLDLGSGIFLPDAVDTFQILQTLNSVSGAFTNVASGDRLTTAEGLGSFVVNYGLESPFGFNNVVLSDFQFDPTADFDNDGDVDAADLAMWQTAYATSSVGDTDADGDSDGRDFLRWQRQFGINPNSLEAASVPEPCGIALLLLALLSISNVSRRAR